MSEQEIAVPPPLPADTMEAVHRFVAHELAELRGRPPAYGPSIVMSGAAWGKYVGRAMRYSMQTLLAPANLAALRGRLRLVLYTDAEGFSHLERATRPFALLGIEPPIVRLIPRELMELSTKHPVVKFLIIGAVHNLGMRMAAQIDAGFHMYMPDHAYGERYFENVERLRQRHACICHTSISADIDAAAPELDRFRSNGVLAVPDRDLGDIAYRHLHKQSRSHLMNGALADRLPHSHAIFAWQSEDAVHVYCPHQNVAWLSPMLCTRAADFYPATMDTRLPQLAGWEFYVPSLEDGMAYIELSDANKPALPSTRSMSNWARHVWGQIGFDDRYVAYFSRPSRLPIRPRMDFVDEAEIAARFAELMNRLRRLKAQAALEAQQGLYRLEDEEEPSELPVAAPTLLAAE